MLGSPRRPQEEASRFDSTIRPARWWEPARCRTPVAHRLGPRGPVQSTAPRGCMTSSSYSRAARGRSSISIGGSSLGRAQTMLGSTPAVEAMAEPRPTAARPMAAEALLTRAGAARPMPLPRMRAEAGRAAGAARTRTAAPRAALARSGTLRAGSAGSASWLHACACWLGIAEGIARWLSATTEESSLPDMRMEDDKRGTEERNLVGALCSPRASPGLGGATPLLLSPLKHRSSRCRFTSPSAHRTGEPRRRNDGEQQGRCGRGEQRDRRSNRAPARSAWSGGDHRRDAVVRSARMRSREGQEGGSDQLAHALERAGGDDPTSSAPLSRAPARFSSRRSGRHACTFRSAW